MFIDLWSVVVQTWPIKYTSLKWREKTGNTLRRHFCLYILRNSSLLSIIYIYIEITLDIVAVPWNDGGRFLKWPQWIVVRHWLLWQLTTNELDIPVSYLHKVCKLLYIKQPLVKYSCNNTTLILWQLHTHSDTDWTMTNSLNLSVRMLNMQHIPHYVTLWNLFDVTDDAYTEQQAQWVTVSGLIFKVQVQVQVSIHLMFSKWKKGQQVII